MLWIYHSLTIHLFWGTMNRVAINIQGQVFVDLQLSIFSGNYLEWDCWVKC